VAWSEGGQKRGLEHWVMEARRLPQTVACGDLSDGNPAPITPEYEQQADAVIELQLEKRVARNYSVALGSWMLIDLCWSSF